jgi:hypothetical protein
MGTPAADPGRLDQPGTVGMNESLPKSKPLFQIRLPRRLIRADVGLGDLLEKSTSAAGIIPCNRCRRRANTLNRLNGFASKAE